MSTEPTESRDVVPFGMSPEWHKQRSLEAKLQQQHAALLAARDALEKLIKAEQSSINELGFREIFALSAAITEANTTLVKIREVVG